MINFSLSIASYIPHIDIDIDFKNKLTGLKWAEQMVNHWATYDSNTEEKI